MDNPQAERLALAEPPWTVVLSGSPADAHEVAWRLQTAGTVARILRGSKSATLDAFYSEVAAALQFPDYFGENWDALNECLADLSWLPGAAYVLIVADAHMLLRNAKPDPLSTFLEIAESVATGWATPADLDKPWGHASVPFHVLFQVSADAREQWNERLARAGRIVPVVDQASPSS